MKKEKNKTNKVLIILGILIGILSLLGISYAIWVLKLNQTNFNIVNSSCLKLNLINEKNDINIENAYPLLNEEGKSLTPYEFTIENTCDLFVSYSVNLEVLDETTLPIKYVSVLLNEEGVQRLSNFDTVEATLKNISISKELYKGGIGAGETNNYKLRLWLSEDVGPEDTDAMNKIFTSKVTVTASAGIYDPLKQGYDKISDAILANEYQTSPEISKQKIAAKQNPDFTKTAPLIIWNENIGGSLVNVTSTMPHPDLVALKDTDERFKNLTDENVLLTIGTNYIFNKDTGKYDLTNVSQKDPTTLNYNDNTKYYYCGSRYNINSSDVITTVRNTNCATLYEIRSASISDGTATGTTGTSFKTRTYNLKGYAMNQIENESDKSDKGLYQIDDDDGISYYYRGSVKNNYVKYAGYYWRIVRINGDGSVRLLYDGKTPNVSGDGFNILSWKPFNSKRDNPAYTGYMYGNTLNESYDKSNSNEVDSNVKTELDNWYKANILDTNNGAIIADAGFCDDRSVSSGNGYSTNGSTTIYNVYNRFYKFKSPTLSCSLSNDLFTTSTSNKGNKALTYPIGLLTVDELMMSGYADGYINKSAYTISANSYWILSPCMYTVDNASSYAFQLYSVGYLGGFNKVSDGGGIRPVINILGESKISGGIGTASDPFLISV